MKRLVKIAVSQLVAMPEAERPYYDPENYRKLKRRIATQGFKKRYAVSGIWNKKLGKWEIHIGTHRLRASRELGLKEIWMWKTNISRKEAVMEAYADNDTNAAVNPMQRCHAFKSMLEIASKEHKKTGAGRNPTLYARLIVGELAKIGENVSESTVEHHLKLGELPKSVQDLIGHGKLRIKQAVLSFPLLGKISQKELEQFLMKASKQYWKPSRVSYEVKELLKKSEGQAKDVCGICGAKIRQNESPLRTFSQAPSYIRKINRWQSICQECVNGVNAVVNAFVEERRRRRRRMEEIRRKYEVPVS